MTHRILVIDDERGLRQLCHDVLTKAGYQVDTVDTGLAGLQAMAKHRYQLVLCDIGLPDTDGVTLLPKLLAHEPPPCVILITAFPSIDTAVRGMKRGARDYLGKPFSPDELRLVVARAIAEDELAKAHRQLKTSLAHGALIGNAPPMQALRQAIDRAALADSPVLITGESGSGKELVARAIHYGSRRAGEAFVPVNCGALASNLLESELFGHVRGAFTGADHHKRGLFAVADQGTLLLDEIGELPVGLQPMLLRALQDGEIKPVGATAPSKVNPRVIAATNRNLTSLIAQAQFRDDLYYRLAVITIDVPPLRDRATDVPALASYFADLAAQRNGRPRPQFTDRALADLAARPWRGNVRELENVVERAVIMAASSTLDIADITDPAASGGDELGADLGLISLDQVERSHILRVMQHCGGQKSKAATVLGINRSTLWKKLRLYGIATDEE